MLFEFIDMHRDAIIARSREKVIGRLWPQVSTAEIEHGVPLFLSQLSDTLRLETKTVPSSGSAMGTTAALHGRDLLAQGFTVSQVVHDYGDICQAVTELAVERDAPITTEEFQMLNGCLDTAIAEAVTEHARITAQSHSSEEVERSGALAHEIRDILNTALFAFHALKRGTVAINGSTGAVLGRSLMGLRDLVDTSLSDIRMTANHQRREWILVKTFLDDIAVGAALHAQYRGLLFVVDPIDDTMAIVVDPQLLASAVMNLLNNAFKYTPTGGRIVLCAHRDGPNVRMEVEDECGGIPESRGDPFQSFGERRGADRTGLGLGLSIARKAVRAHGGDIHIRNRPGRGCVFVVEVPLAGEATTAGPASAAVKPAI